MVLTYVFGDDRRIRFSQFPAGGGEAKPTWDFQLIVPEPCLDKTHGFRAQLIYKPFVNAEDAKAEAPRWLSME